MSTTKRASIKKRLAALYPDSYESVAEKLFDLLDEFKSKIPASKNTEVFSEKDVVLITYADHVQEKGTKTLQTMSKFLETYAKGIVNSVHFLPFYPYSSDDGFSVIDYYKIKEEFGTWKDVTPIAKDFKLMYDFVINHISQYSDWFQKFLAGDPEYQEYFIAYDSQVDTSAVFRPRTHPLLTPFVMKDGKTKYVWTTFSDDQIDINFGNPDVLIAMMRVFLFYFAEGAQIIRLDAITYLWKILGTACVKLPQTHEVVKLMRDIVDDVAPHVWIITETNVPHADNIAFFGNGKDEAHQVYNFTLPPLLLYSYITQDTSVLTKWAASLEYPSDMATFFNFTASHDGIGVTPLKGIIPQEEISRIANHVLAHGGKVNYRAVAGQDPQPYELNIVYLSAFGGNVDAFLASQAVSLTLRGVPAIYLNSFIGAENWTEGVEKLGYNRAVNRQKFSYQTLKKELGSAKSKKHTVYNRYSHVLKVRQQEPLFHPKVPQDILSLDPSLFVIKRHQGNNMLLGVINMTSKHVSLPTASLTKQMGNSSLKDSISGRIIDHGSKHVDIRPYEVLWLKKTSS